MSTTRSVRTLLAAPACAMTLLLGATPGGALDETTVYDVSDDLAYAITVAVGPDGSVWARGEHSIGRLDQATGDIDPLCAVTDADYPDIDSNYIFEIDPEGRLWLPWTPDGSDVPAGLRILRIDPVTCAIDDFELTDASFGAADIVGLPGDYLLVSTFNRLLLINADTGAPIADVDGPFPYFDSMVTDGGDLVFGVRSSDGTLWVVDADNGPGATELSPAGFDYIRGVAMGPDGRVWFAGGDGAGGILVGSVAADGTDLQSHDPEIDGVAAGMTFGPDGNLWVSNNTPSQLHVIDPATATLVRSLDFVELGMIPGSLAADDSAVWAAIVVDGALVRVSAVDPADPTDPTDPADPTTPTAPAAQPTTAAPRFTG